MRTFVDSSGEDWTVFEVRRQAKADGTKGGGADLSYLPSGYSSGWLCFENPTSKRRLIVYPERWREMTDAQLGELLNQATPAPRASLRLTDLSDTSSGADIRPE